jgi:hypothetical protein
MMLVVDSRYSPEACLLRARNSTELGDNSRLTIVGHFQHLDLPRLPRLSRRPFLPFDDGHREFVVGPTEHSHSTPPGKLNGVDCNRR